MAVLNKIRQRSVFLIVIIALALFSFVLADVIRNGGFSNKTQSTIATVNGEDIDRIAFMEQVEAYQRQLGPNASSTQAINTVWEQELRNILLRQQYDELGLMVGQDALDDAYSTFLAGNPTFQDETGSFNLGLIDQYVASIQGNPEALEQWQQYVETTKNSVLQNTYLNMVRSGMIATLSDGEQAYRRENDKINIEYVQVPYTKIADEDVEVTEAEIEAYVRDHADEFEVEPMVDIQYVSFNEQPSEADVAAAREEMAQLLEDEVVFNNVTNSNDTIPGFRNATDIADYINANSEVPYQDRWYFRDNLPASIKDTLFDQPAGFIYGPYKEGNTFNYAKVVDAAQKFDSVSSKHILIRYQGSLRASSAITRSKEEAEQLADSLKSVIGNSASRFDELVSQFSDDATTKENNGDLGYYGPGAMVEPYDDFIFNNDQGSIGVVETDFGYHVVLIEDQKNLQRTIKLAILSKEIEPSEETLNDVFSQATGLEVAAQDGDFNAVAEEQGLTARPVNRVGRMDSNIPGIGNNRAIVNWAFEAETKVGDVKRFNVPTGYVIAQVTRKNDSKALMSVAEASSRVTPILRNEKKAQMIRQSITGTTLEEIAASQNVTVKNATAVTLAAPTIAGAGTEPEVVGAAFGKAAGEQTGLIDGNSGVFVVKVLAVNPAPDLENYESYANQINNALAPQVTNSVYQALRKKAEIEDNRSTFY
jgi:peptidylprolyl isomerase/peptidyl-prolyl cis-trans isomerase D